MMVWTILWIALPLFLGFSLYLLPGRDRPLGRVLGDRNLALVVALVSLAYALVRLGQPSPWSWQLLDTGGVTLMADELSGYFILTNALVTAAVILYCWGSDRTSTFYTQLIILHGSINAVFICADVISLYVALEVVGIAAFLLIAYPRTNRSLWVGLRYLFVGNTALLFYLVGVALLYQAQQSFAFAALANAPAEALALMTLGLLVKGGLFVSGLWLPGTHAEAESPVSALLSGVVVKAGVFPIVRCALMFEELELSVRILGVLAALLGVLYALFEVDTKRMLACSTLSQLGWVLTVPEAAGFYALAHGLGKAALFLVVGNLPSRNLLTLRQQGIETRLWVPLTLGSLSIAGFPLLAGFGAKMLTLKQALPWQATVLNLAAVGTATLYAKFIFLPQKAGDQPDRSPLKLGFWLGVGLLLGALLVASLGDLEVFNRANGVKALTIVAAGCLLHRLSMQRLTLVRPRGAEYFQHLVGGMSVILVILFWVTRSWQV